MNAWFDLLFIHVLVKNQVFTNVCAKFAHDEMIPLAITVPILPTPSRLDRRDFSRIYLFHLESLGNLLCTPLFRVQHTTFNHKEHEQKQRQWKIIITTKWGQQRKWPNTKAVERTILTFQNRSSLNVSFFLLQLTLERSHLPSCLALASKTWIRIEPYFLVRCIDLFNQLCCAWYMTNTEISSSLHPKLTPIGCRCTKVLIAQSW